jgi:hypothetical protein
MLLSIEILSNLAWAGSISPPFSLPVLFFNWSGETVASPELFPTLDTAAFFRTSGCSTETEIVCGEKCIPE